ncbi:MAG: response regulator, partial [Candidatus Omnitrophica bacterium]|nr:response regulator [Candidatus Omnitrophota bacterium]
MLKLLLVDDDKVTRDMLKNILTKEGFDCLVAENGEQGFKIFKENTPKLVITDFRMPICDGQALMAKI